MAAVYEGGIRCQYRSCSHTVEADADNCCAICRSYYCHSHILKHVHMPPRLLADPRNASFDHSVCVPCCNSYYAELEEAKSEALSLNQKSSTNPRGQGLSPEGDETCTTFSPAARSVRTIVDVPVGDVSFTGSMGDTGDIGSGGEMGDVGDVGDVGSGGGEGSVGSAGSYFSVASVKGHPDEEAQAEQRQGRIGQCGVSVDADVDMGASAGGGVGARVQELLSQVQQLEEERQADRQSERQDWAY